MKQEITLTNVMDTSHIISITSEAPTMIELKSNMSNEIMSACAQNNCFGTFFLEVTYTEDEEYVDSDETMINVMSPEEVKRERKNGFIAAKQAQMFDNIMLAAI